MRIEAGALYTVETKVSNSQASGETSSEKTESVSTLEAGGWLGKVKREDDALVRFL